MERIYELKGVKIYEKIVAGKLYYKIQIYCELESRWISKCYLEQRQPKAWGCDNCEYYKRKIQSEKRCDQIKKEIKDTKRIVEEAEDQGRLGPPLDPLAPLDLKKRGKKLPTELYLPGFYENKVYIDKKHRARFDKDYRKRNRFHHSFLQICNRLGIKIALKKTIRQIMEEPEMKWVKRSKSPQLRTLAAWRRELCWIFQEEDPDARIYGRMRSKLAHTPKDR